MNIPSGKIARLETMRTEVKAVLQCFRNMEPPKLVRIRRRGGVIEQDCDVYIGRAMYQGGWRLSASPWANPYSVKQYGRERALALYREHLLSSRDLLLRLPDLAGKTLGCWCYPEPCHGDIIIEAFLSEVSAGKTEKHGDRELVPVGEGSGDEGAGGDEGDEGAGGEGGGEGRQEDNIESVSILDLPEEVLAYLCSYMGKREFALLRSTCKELRKKLRDACIPQNTDVFVERAIHHIRTKSQCLLITGPAGSGKSTLLKTLYYRCRSPLFGRQVLFAATTWRAAVLLPEARTLHSVFRINPSDLTPKAVKKSFGAFKRHPLKKVDVFVVDEASMLSREVLHYVDMVLRYLHDTPHMPFGGKMLVLCGDLLQLGSVDGSWFFDALAWKEATFRTVHLRLPMRQAEDTLWFHRLQRIRRGVPTAYDIDCLRKLVKPTTTQQLVEEFLEGRRIPVMFTHRNQVAEMNDAVMSALPSEEIILSTVMYHNGVQQPVITKYGIPETITVKAGALCIITHVCVTDGNILRRPGELCEFSRVSGGDIMLRFYNDGASPPEVSLHRVDTKIIIANRRAEKEDDVYHFYYFPISLAYGLTIHAAQGMTLDKLTVTLGNVFATGQAYTALSRVRKESDVTLLDFDPRCIKVSQKALKFYEDHKIFEL